MGNSLVYDRQGNPMITYYTEDAFKMARLVDGKWKKVGQLVSDQTPHGTQVPVAESQIRIEPAPWADIVVGVTRYTVQRTP